MNPGAWPVFVHQANKKRSRKVWPNCVRCRNLYGKLSVYSIAFPLNPV
jgi:hypothetical protein